MAMSNSLSPEVKCSAAIFGWMGFATRLVDVVSLMPRKAEDAVGCLAGCRRGLRLIVR